jgi:Virulence-associated protein E
MTTSPSDDEAPAILALMSAAEFEAEIAPRAAASPKLVSITSAKKPRRRSPPWLDAAIKDERGRILPILRNAAIALRAAPELSDSFRFDELQRLVIVDKPLPLADGAEPRNTSHPRPLTDGDVSQVQEWLQHMGVPKIGREIMGQAIHLCAQEQSFHPVRDYLDNLKWDGVKRLERWLPRYLGADESPYARAIGRMFMIGARRVPTRMQVRLRGCSRGQARRRKVARVQRARRGVVQRFPARRTPGQRRRPTSSRKVDHRNIGAVGARSRGSRSVEVLHLTTCRTLPPALRARGSHRASSVHLHRDNEPLDISRR